jgi:hypothetical protein
MQNSSLIHFLGIGAQKAGTTWLFENLMTHPQIFFPAGKEIHFWDKKSSNGLDWYFSKFNSINDEDICKGEITPSYSILKSETIKQIHEYLPNIKIIYILRNPLERAWSAARMNYFRQNKLFHDNADSFFIEDIYSSESIMRGDYESCLKNWLRFYSMKQILILFYEDIEKNPGILLNKCFNHLGVGDLNFENNSKLGRRVFVGEDVIMSSQIREILHEIYDSKIISLEKFLGVDLSRWLR